MAHHLVATYANNTRWGGSSYYDFDLTQVVSIEVRMDKIALAKIIAPITSYRRKCWAEVNALTSDMANTRFVHVFDTPREKVFVWDNGAVERLPGWGAGVYGPIPSYHPKDAPKKIIT